MSFNHPTMRGSLSAMKEIVAQEIAKRVKDGDVIGVGTGTTVDAALTEIGKRVKAEGLRITVVPTSYQSAWRCQELGFIVMYPGYRGHLSWGFDGADQVNQAKWAIKGKGGAMLQEKILAKRCKKFVLIVDESKVVSELGKGCPIPV
jgi:ribose 5-phosphate isomerase A